MISRAERMKTLAPVQIHLSFLVKGEGAPSSRADGELAYDGAADIGSGWLRFLSLRS